MKTKRFIFVAAQIDGRTVRRRLAFAARGFRAVWQFAFLLILCAGCGDGRNAAHNSASVDPIRSEAESKEEAQKALKRGGDAFDKSQFKVAIAECSKAIELDPKCAKAYFVRGEAKYNFVMDVDGMVADDTIAIQLEPAGGLPYVSRAGGYQQKGQYEKAIADYSEAIRLRVTTRNMVSCYWGRGRCYAALGDFQKAIDDYTEAARLDPKFSGAYHERGMAYKAMGESDKAQADLKHAEDLGYGRSQRHAKGT